MDILKTLQSELMNLKDRYEKAVKENKKLYKRISTGYSTTTLDKFQSELKLLIDDCEKLEKENEKLRNK